MTLCIAVIVAVVAGYALLVVRWERRQVARLPVVGMRAYLSRRPADISIDRWLAARHEVGLIAGLDPARIDPDETIGSITNRLSFMGICQVDFDWVLYEIPRKLSREEVARVKTIGDVLALYAREMP